MEFDSIKVQERQHLNILKESVEFKKMLNW